MVPLAPLAPLVSSSSNYGRLTRKKARSIRRVNLSFGLGQGEGSFSLLLSSPRLARLVTCVKRVLG